MPVLGFDTYTIDFAILEDNDPKTITLFDKSTYIGTPELPLVQVTMPGFTGHVNFAYIPSTVISITSDSLNLTYNSSLGATADLPDGVYQIALKNCPYDEFFLNKCYLKTSQFNRSFECFLRSMDNCSCCKDDQKIKEEIIDIEILILSAKAEVSICNIGGATTKFNAAVKKLTNLNKKLNCQ